MDWGSEFFGASRVANVTANGYLLAPPGRMPGACRFYRLTPDASRTVVLPRGDLVPDGESVTVYNASGSNTLTLIDQAANTIGSVSPGIVASVYKFGSSTNGSWILSLATLFGESGSLTLGRLPLDVRFGADATTFDLRRHHDVLSNYDGVTPAALRVWVGTADRHYVIGASGYDSTNETAFDTGEWPAGTTLLLFNFGTIVGKGGAGGRGADVAPGLLGQPGGFGTTGLRCRIPTVIANYGTIAGGGGGGGGGIVTGLGGNISGSGGGGGAGHDASLGGQPGSGGGGVAGVGGSAHVAGGGGNPGVAGGGGTGGAHGTAGADGISGGGAGGAAGSAILRLTGVPVTKIVTGTISGAEGTF